MQGTQAPTSLTYLGLSPFGVTDDRKATLDVLFSRLDTGVAGVTGYNQLIARDKGGQVFNVLAYGAVGDGATDCTAAINAAMAAATNGGVIYFPRPAVSYLIAGAIVFPNDAATVPQQKSFKWLGDGASHSGRNAAPNGGTILDCTYNGANAAKIETLGQGLLQLEGITFKDSGVDSKPFIQTTNTTLQVLYCEFYGTVAGITAAQDAIVLGGTGTAAGGTTAAPYQGYGSLILGCYFNQIRRCAYLRTFANGVVFTANTVWASCGASGGVGAAVESLGDVTNSNVAVVISDNIFETSNYEYTIKLTKYSLGFQIVNNGFYDQTANTTAFIRLDDATIGANYIAANYYAGKPLVSDNTGGANVQTIIDSLSSGSPSKFGQPVEFDTTVNLKNSGLGENIYDASSNVFGSQMFNPANAFTYTPNGGSLMYLGEWIATSTTTSTFQIGIASTTTGTLAFANLSNAFLTSITAGVPAATRLYVLPVVDPTAGQALVGTLAGSTVTLSYATVPTISGTAVAQQVAYWSSATAVAGDAGFTLAGTGATATLTVTQGYITGANGAYGWAAEIWTRIGTDAVLLRDATPGATALTYRVARSFTSSAAYIASQMTWDAGNSFLTFGGFRAGTGVGVDCNHMATDAVGANQAGSNCYLSAGRATGTGTGGSLVFQVGTTSLASSSTVSAWYLGAAMQLTTQTAFDLILGGGGADGRIVLGNQSNAFTGTITPAAFASSKTFTLPDATGTFALGTGAAGQVAYWSATNIETSNANFAYNTTTGVAITAAAANTGLTVTGVSAVAAANFVGNTPLRFGTASDNFLVSQGNTNLWNFIGANGTPLTLSSVLNDVGIDIAASNVKLRAPSSGLLILTSFTNTAAALQRKYLISPKTTGPVTVSATVDFDTVYTNTGALGSVTFNLPAATGSGISYEFTRDAAQNMVITANGTDTVQIGASVTTAGGTVTLTAPGSKIRITDEASGKWFGFIAGAATFA